MWAILIAGDCRSWFESGAVTDVLIEGNTFTGCKPIHIHPENTEVDAGKPVHRNIRILNNTFELVGPGTTIVDAKSTRGLAVRSNVLALGRQSKSTDENSLVKQTGCTDVSISENTIRITVEQ